MTRVRPPLGHSDQILISDVVAVHIPPGNCNNGQEPKLLDFSYFQLNDEGSDEINHLYTGVSSH